MASVCNDPNGRRRIAFVAPDGAKVAIRLGVIPRKVADSVCLHVEHLLASIRSGQPVPGETSVWVKNLTPWLHGKLSKAGLIVAKMEAPLFEALAEKYFSRKDIKDTTKSTRRYYRNMIAEFLGTKRVDQVNLADADGLRDHLADRGLAGPTIGRTLRFARQVFKMAIREKWILSNPMDALAHNFREGNGKPRQYISPEVVDAWMECAPAPWRVLVALARYGGLRAPSEALLLRWSDVDLAKKEMTVSSPKTETQGKPWRRVPIRPRLAEILEEAWLTQVTQLGPRKPGFSREKVKSACKSRDYKSPFPGSGSSLGFLFSF